MTFDTLVGRVDFDIRSIETSLGHRFGQKKLDALAAIPDGMRNAVYLGSSADFQGKPIENHYFAFPIEYSGARELVFCRARQDANKNRIYVHEVFLESEIAEAGSIQIAAATPGGPVAEPRTGTSLYRRILQEVYAVNPEKFLNVLDENGEPEVSNGSFDAQNPDIRFSRPVGRLFRAPRDLPPDDRYLAVLHNLSASKLFSAARLGGLAVPSLAITDVRNPHTGFGDITLIGDSSLADPEQPGNKVFSADVYSPTFPRVERSMAPSDFKRFHKEMVALSGLGRKAGAFSQADIFEDKFSGFYHNTLRAARRRNGTLKSRSGRKENAQTKEGKWSGNRPQRRLRQKFLPPMIGRKKLRGIIPENAAGKI